MIIKCIANTSNALSTETFKLGYENTPSFNIEIGAEFVVYGISLWKGSIDYLVSNKVTKNPEWFPAELFEVTSKILPVIWYFNFERYKNYKGEDVEKAIWGYKELVKDAQHYSNLAENQKESIEIFKKRKRQIDEYENILAKN